MSFHIPDPIQMMRVLLNGEQHEVPEESTLEDLLATLDLAQKRFAVEVNEELVPRSEHPTHALKTDDRIEIVQAIGGG